MKTCSIFEQTDDGEARSLLEGVIMALTARRAAPGETLILGSAAAALRCRILPEGAALKPTVRHMRLHFFAVAYSRLSPRLLL